MSTNVNFILPTFFLGFGNRKSVVISLHKSVTSLDDLEPIWFWPSRATGTLKAFASGSNSECSCWNRRTDSGRKRSLNLQWLELPTKICESLFASIGTSDTSSQQMRLAKITQMQQSLSVMYYIPREYKPEKRNTIRSFLGSLLPVIWITRGTFQINKW